MRLKKKFIIYILVFLLLGCQSQQQDTEKSVFSWHKQEVLNGKDDFFNTLQSFNVQYVYQYFSSDLTDDQIDSFINECSQQDISVYYLCGTPEYALSENYTQLSQEIERAKFAVPELGEMLLSTGDAYLEEGNHWHDNRWGHCTCDKCKNKTAQNLLGNILMQVRTELSEAKENEQQKRT